MGNTERLVATIVPSGASEKGLSWSSSDEEVATVSSNGLVTALQGGTTTITVMTVEGGFTASCKVVVAEKEGGFYRYATEFDLCDSKGGHTSTDYIRIQTYIHNMGTVNSYLASCTYDVLTEDGTPVQSIDDFYVVASPWIIEPGDYGFFTTVVSLSEARSDLKVVEHTVVKNAKNEEAVRYDISNLTFGTDDLLNRLVVKGKVTNNTTKQASTLDQIVIILYDAEKNYLSTYVDALPVALKPGESCVFEASNLIYGALKISKEAVVYYRAFAFPWTYVY